jgi:hypothetical protein
MPGTPASDRLVSGKCRIWSRMFFLRISRVSIGIGEGSGWVMLFNVWGVIWRIQKKSFAGPATVPPTARPFRSRPGKTSLPSVESERAPVSCDALLHGHRGPPLPHVR